MIGQLWQECRCGNEPVCAVCEECSRHCTCDGHETTDAEFDAAWLANCLAIRRHPDYPDVQARIDRRDATNA